MMPSDCSYPRKFTVHNPGGDALEMRALRESVRESRSEADMLDIPPSDDDDAID